jgi:two-component system, NtrC family, response regulator AtoC
MLANGVVGPRLRSKMAIVDARGGRNRESTQAEGAAKESNATQLLVAGEGLLTTYSLVKPEVVIGRGDDCDVVVRSATLSRRHALLRLGPPLTLQDLESRNGTRIGGEVHRGGRAMPLSVGDAFHVGRLSFIVIGAPRDATQSVRSDLGNALRVEDPTLEPPPAHLRDIAKSDVNVLILGETGVGKEVLAETLHRLSGRSGPLVRINCAALSSALLESELFGHEKGAFTGANESKPGLLASAKGGTVMLDEVGELPAALQAKLLRAIETKEILPVGSVRPLAIDLRFIAATNRDLPTEVASGQFRADLFFRLDGVTLEIPPLRARRRLIGPLALRFLDEAQRASGSGRARLSAEALRQLEEHRWPGNVRELKASIGRALLLARGRDIKPQHLGLRAAHRAPEPLADGGLNPDELQERELIIAALSACAGNQTRAARRLGVSRATLTHKLALYRIPRPRK